MRGIVGAAGYVPVRRLGHGEVAAFLAGRPWPAGTGAGPDRPGARPARQSPGARAVAGADEDTTTMAVEAARLVLRGAPDGLRGDDGLSSVRFATTAPAQMDKTNAAVVHAALCLEETVGAFDAGGGLRSGIGAVLQALDGQRTHLVVAADQRDGLPGGADEVSGGDAAGAVVVADDSATAPLLAEVVATASATTELLDRWRVPGERRSRTWEERFAETALVPVAERTIRRALTAAGLDGTPPDRLVVTGMHQRAVAATTRRLTADQSTAPRWVSDSYARQIGQAGCAHPLLALADLLETARADRPGTVLVLAHLADGVDVVVLRTTSALIGWHPARTVANQVAQATRVPYAKFLAWRGMLTPEPPRRPAPPRVSAPAAARRAAWKFGFVGSRDRTTGLVHLPPTRAGMGGGPIDQMDPAPMADAVGRVATFTVDTMVHTPDPPVVFAVVDFDEGGRFPMELTDVDAEAVTIGMEVEPTFRRLWTADGIPNYFWKARPHAASSADTSGSG